MKEGDHILFWVVGRVSKKARIKPTDNSVTTLYDNTMLISFQEFFVDEDIPLGMVHFAVTVSHKLFCGPFSSRVLDDKIFELVW
jgi:hypothetical protein